MQIRQLRFDREFEVQFGNDKAQAAVMTLAPGGKEGDADNRHRGADQWLYVVDGEGEAIVDSRSHPLRKGSLLLIEHGERHEIRNTGDGPLRTLNLYTPPAYDAQGEPLPRGEP